MLNEYRRGHNPPRETRLLTMAEVAERLRLTLSTLRNWRVTGGGPPGARMGKHVLFRETDLEDWIHARFEPAVLPPGALPPGDAAAAARYFPWPDLAEEIATVTAEVFTPSAAEVNAIHNAVWDAMADAYAAYMDGIHHRERHDDAQAAAMRELRDGLAQHLRPLRKARAGHQDDAHGLSGVG